jgi:hypothetical protein
MELSFIQYTKQKHIREEHHRTHAPQSNKRMNASFSRAAKISNLA